MYSGARITDQVDYFRAKGESSGAIKVVRARTPERFRWRMAVAAVTSVAAPLQGRDRMRIEEPVREMVLDLSDPFLKREVVLDARRYGIDLDRGEVLPQHTMLDLRRSVYLAGADMSTIIKHVKLPESNGAFIDTAGVILVGRAYADAHRRRAHKLWLQIPDEESQEPQRLHHKIMAERAQRDADLAQRWAALAKALAE